MPFEPVYGWRITPTNCIACILLLSRFGLNLVRIVRFCTLVVLDGELQRDREEIIVQQDHLIPSTITALDSLIHRLRTTPRIAVQYTSAAGMCQPREDGCGSFLNPPLTTGRQDGQDGGGLFRDWLGRCALELFTPGTPQSVVCAAALVEGIQYVSWNPRLLDTVDGCARARLAGLLIALARVRALPLGIHFAPHVLKLLLGLVPEFDDLRFVEPERHDILQR